MSRYHDARRFVSESDAARRERELHDLDQQFKQPPVVPTNRSVHQQMLAAGVEVDNHESDLYAKVTPESTRILEEAGITVDGHNASVFTSQVDGQKWYDLPFRYEPFWHDKAANDTRHQPTTDERSCREVADKIGELLDAVLGKSFMTDDRALGNLIRGLQQTNDTMREHLNANYIWD